MKGLLDLSCALLFSLTALAQKLDYDPLLYVDQLIGTAGDGHVFAGATLPYGMAKAVADTDSSENQAGYVSSANVNVTGFSALHDSGTGGLPSLGNFALFAHPYCPGDELDRCVFPKKTRKVGYRNDTVTYSPGYFGIELRNGIKVDMTSAMHTSLFRFNFASSKTGAKDGGPLLQLDLTDLSDSRQDNGTISVNPTTGRMTGGAKFIPSFAQGTYNAFFCVDFKGNRIRDSGIYVNSRASTDVKDLTISRSINGYPLPGGAFLRFEDTSQILARVGLSFISSEQACSNAEKEVPEFDIGRVKIAAERAWRAKLTPIKVARTGVSEGVLRTFYSGIYRTMISPQDYTGENQLWQSDEPYFDSFYCIWDLFRSQLPFLTIIDPHQVSRMIRGLLDIYRHEGWLPDCRMSFCRGYTQGGSNADVVMADAYLKNITDGVDWAVAYEAVVKDAEIEPFDWSSQGRGGLDSWHDLGYIPVQDFDYKGFGTMTRSISRTLEYSYNDFTIAQMARRMMDVPDRESDKYLERSKNWQNLWKPDQKSLINGTDTGFVGFLQPKFLNGTWGYQDPLTCSNIDKSNAPCSLQNTAAETFESSIWEYNFFVPHDMGTLVQKFGGPKKFISRLEYLHDRNISDIGNEPAFLTVFQYHYGGRPGLSSKRARYYIGRYFTARPDGIPGNDDSGAMGSFAAFAMMGLFPNAGQNVYLITAPYFERLEITSPATGKTAIIRTANFDAACKDCYYIQDATLNGDPWTRNWLSHEFFTMGMELVVTVGRNESKWGTRAKDLPPSVGAYVGFDDDGPASGYNGIGRSNYTRVMEVQQPDRVADNLKMWGALRDGRGHCEPEKSRPNDY